MITGGMVEYRTEEEWNETGYQILATCRDHYQIIDGVKKYDSYSIGSNLKICSECGKEYSTNYNYFFELLTKMQSHLKTEMNDSTCDSCLKKKFGFEENDCIYLNEE